MPFPKEQEECVLRAPLVAYQSVWGTPEQQKSQYSSVVTEYGRLLADTPMIDWKAKSGTYPIRPPYTLVVPTAYPEAMNINTPEYALAQGFTVALHSLSYAYNNGSGCESMPMGVAAQHLATFPACPQLDYESTVGLLHGKLP